MLDLTPDELLSTTRSVRRRLDLTRPVPRHLLEECLELALQAPSAGNRQEFQYIFVSDPHTKSELADLFRRAKTVGATTSIDPDRTRLYAAADYMEEHLHEIPWFVIPCFKGRIDSADEQVVSGQSTSYNHAAAVKFGSIVPSMWSFMLAARARGLGTTLTTRHLRLEREAAEILGMPYTEFTQAGLIVLAYSVGTSFRPGPRMDISDIAHWERW